MTISMFSGLGLSCKSEAMQAAVSISLHSNEVTLARTQRTTLFHPQ